MFTGQLVTVTDAWGRKLKRRVVIASDRKVWVCTVDEYEKASRECREPNSIGFPLEDVRFTTKSQ